MEMSLCWSKFSRFRDNAIPESHAREGETRQLTSLNQAVQVISLASVIESAVNPPDLSVEISGAEIKTLTKMRPFGVKWPRDRAESIQIQILSDCKTDRAIGEKFRLRSLRLELGTRDENHSLAAGQKAPQLSRDSPPAD